MSPTPEKTKLRWRPCVLSPTSSWLRRQDLRPRRRLGERHEKRTTGKYALATRVPVDDVRYTVFGEFNQVCEIEKGYVTTGPSR